MSVLCCSFKLIFDGAELEGFQPERDIHEVHSSCEWMVWDASSSREGDSGLQSKVFKNPSPRAHSSYHLRQMLRDCQQNIWGIWKCSHIIILQFQIWLDNQIIVVFTYLTEKYGDTGQRPKHKMNAWLVINYFWKNTFNSKREIIVEQVVCFYLWTVWEATKKDIRSPGDISLLEIKVPPAKIVPRTMPVLTRHKNISIMLVVYQPAKQCVN